MLLKVIRKDFMEVAMLLISPEVRTLQEKMKWKVLAKLQVT